MTSKIHGGLREQYLKHAMWQQWVPSNSRDSKMCPKQLNREYTIALRSLNESNQSSEITAQQMDGC